MLKFYRQTSNQFTNWVEDKLEEMVVAHKLVEVDGDTSLPEEVTQDELPILSDGHESWRSEDEIREFLKQLHQDLLLSQKLQSDACHINPDNPEECL